LACSRHGSVSARCIGIAWLLAKLLFLSCAIVLIETVNAKTRLFRVPELLAVAFTLGSLALISTFPLLRLMTPFLDMQIGDRIITLMAALVLVLQIAMVSQRWIVTHIRIFAIQSFFLAMIAATIAWFNHAPHIYIAAALTLVVKVILVPILFERLVERMDIHEEIEPIVNVPLSVLISGGLTLVGYVVAESFYKPGEPGLGHNALAVAISLFLIGFFTMINRRKALTQVLALLSLENGLFLAAISLTYGMPLIVELGILFDVLVAAMVLGILVYRIRETFESMDVSRLRRLRG
jgi:hydrogenase-4 component E